MNTNGKDVYFVAVKLFLRKGGKLLILKDNFGDWDLPGGRIKADEFETPLEDVLRRKIKEELGENLTIDLAEQPIVFMRHERIEQAPGNPRVRIFALGYEGFLKEGEIKLSPRHTEMIWSEMKNLKPEDYFSGGWLQGAKDYLALKKA